MHLNAVDGPFNPVQSQTGVRQGTVVEGISYNMDMLSTDQCC